MSAETCFVWDNPDAVIAAYQELGSAYKVAAKFSVDQGTILASLKRSGVAADGLAKARQKMRSLSDEQEAEIAKRYARGEKSLWLAKAFSVTVYTVNAALRRQGVEKRESDRVPLTQEQQDQVLEMHKLGMTQKEIGLKVGTSDRTVMLLIARHGLSRGVRSGKDHATWKGGRYCHKGAYWWTLVPDGDVAAPMRDKRGYVLEHRAVLARKLSRPLTEDETVHHIDGNPGNNAEANLQLRQGKHGKGVVHTCRDCGSHNVATERLATLE